MNQFIKIKTIQADSFYYVDPTRFALVSPRVKSRILLHKLRARVHGNSINKKALFYKKALLGHAENP